MENFKTGVVLAVAILIISLRYEAESKSLESPQEKRAKLRQSVESEELGNNPGTPQNDAIDQKTREAGIFDAIFKIGTGIVDAFGKEKTDQMKRLLRLSMDPGTPQNDAVDQKTREAGIFDAIFKIGTGIVDAFGKEKTDQMKRLLRLSMDPGTPQNDAVDQKLLLRLSMDPGTPQNDAVEQKRIKLRQSVESEDLGDNPGIHQNDIEEKTRQRDAMGLQDLPKSREAGPKRMKSPWFFHTHHGGHGGHHGVSKLIHGVSKLIHGSGQGQEEEEEGWEEEEDGKKKMK